MSDESGSLQTSLVNEGELKKSSLDPADVFIVDNGKVVYVWIGNGASADENQNAMPYAHVRQHGMVYYGGHDVMSFV